jgi:uncharacterized protein (DUF1786 family)
MKILTVDIGTGTQDIFLYDSRLDLENGFKLVLPSPTMIVHRRLKDATRRRQAVLLTGVIMGGGPSQWAAEAHTRAGLALYATPQAARTFNDDLEAVKEMGVEIVSEDEGHRLPDSVQRLEMRDFDFASIAKTFESFGVSLHDLQAAAVAVFDHGDAPPGISDRQFRFDYLDERIRAANRLSAFAYRAEEIPKIMTRLQAVASSAQEVNAPLIVMDTAPAAVLGATFDPWVAARRRVLIANVGNFHTLAFRLRAEEPGGYGIEGVFEHHTGLLDLQTLAALLHALADGSLTHAEVFEQHGHGALIYEPEPLPLEAGELQVVVTGPRRSLFNEADALSQLARQTLCPIFAVPFGDMMLAGCFGLLRATAEVMPELGKPILRSLQEAGGTAPWDAS